MKAKKMSSSGSPVGSVDPMVRAINTIMYGMLIHFGSLYVMGVEKPSSFQTNDVDAACRAGVLSSSSINYLRMLWMTLIFHEHWVYLQHSNVLANPYCQHLDRQYGIALLKSNQHWAIAGTLSAYWCRESIGMFLCLPFVTSSTQFLVLYSLVYHTIKSRGVRRDALQRYSPRFGIMRVVIDKFYLHSTSETLLTVLRLFLQGFDTWIHHCIIRDMILTRTAPSTILMSPNTIPMIHGLFVLWVFHAALNQYFRMSTASIMVMAWHSLTARPQGKEHLQEKKDVDKIVDRIPPRQDDIKTTNPEKINASDGDESTQIESVSSDDTETDLDHDQDFVVRHLLRPGRVARELEGRQGAATNGVDTAVRIETSMAVLSLFFLLGLGKTPLASLSLDRRNVAGEITSENAITNMAYAWLLMSLLHGIWAVFLKGRSMRTNQISSADCVQLRVFINFGDLVILISTATKVRAAGATPWAIALLMTSKSYLQANRSRCPPVVWNGIKVLEFAGKLLLARTLSQYPTELMPQVETIIALLWGLWVTSSPTPTPCEVASKSSCQVKPSPADVVFLGHPAELIDCWALWLLPYPLEERWQGPTWAVPLWPLHYVVGWYVCNFRRRLFGDKAAFFSCDDVKYEGTRMQTWTAAHFGRHFVTHPKEVKKNIEAAVRHANDTGVKLLCLGALNKAESINGGGVGVVKMLGKTSKLSVIHGNHLTAAAVVETTVRCFGENAKVFLTGASSKVGWAVAQALRDRHGYEVLCHSTDGGRRKRFETQGFSATSKLSDGTLYSKLWIVGKYDFDVPKLIPQKATAIVFSVPHSLGSRPDIRVVEAGTLHIDLSRLDRPRQFTNKLKAHEIFACHAASLVAAKRLERDESDRILEVGPVDTSTMNSWLDDAKALGINVPDVTKSSKVFRELDKPPVVVVGAGPSGLAVAASLSCRGIPTLVLESNDDPFHYGSWGQHFTGLVVTSQKKWCNLPGLSMFDQKEFPGETVSASDYQRYLRLYAARFDLDIRRGTKVISVEKGTDAVKPWIVQYTDSGEGTSKELAAFSVVIATGKHRIPNRNTSDDLASRLEQAEIDYCHTDDLRNEQTWSRTYNAAKTGRLAVIGFGNSAADIATAVLQKTPTTAKIHIASRTVPPVFPRAASILRVDTIGYYFIRWLPSLLEDLAVKFLWLVIPSSRRCDASFPPHLARWSRIQGRVPVIDKHGTLASGFESGRLVGHGPVREVKHQSLIFDDEASARNGGDGVPIEFVLFATGFESECMVSREDRLNGLFKCGFGNDKLLPLQSIGEEAQSIAKLISTEYFQHCSC